MSKKSSTDDVTPARKAALTAVTQCRKRKAFAQDMIAEYIDSNSKMSVEDRAFAARLVLGVVKTRGVLEEVLNRCLRKKTDAYDDVRDALCISIYEILYLEKSSYAAVDQGVELVRSIVPEAAGLANAVLRKATVIKEDFPFGDPSTDIAAFARAQGFPLWLTELLIDELGEVEARSFIEISHETAPVFIGVNTIKTNDDEVLALFKAAQGHPEQVQVNGHSVVGCYRIESGRVLMNDRIQEAFDDGLIFVSDAAAQLVAHSVLPVRPLQDFLEIGAGRGTKTILLQNDAQRKWGNQIPDYVALDDHGFKIKVLQNRMDVFGVHVAHYLVGDASCLGEVIDEGCTFDAVFIDAPCSGLGTLRRHPEICWRLTPQTIEENAKLGLEMLQSAAPYVAEGGTLAYSTCTITFSENDRVVERFLSSEQGSNFEIEQLNGRNSLSTQLVSGGNDAHFLVKMRREKASCPKEAD